MTVPCSSGTLWGGREFSLRSSRAQHVLYRGQRVSCFAGAGARIPGGQIMHSLGGSVYLALWCLLLAFQVGTACIP